ncbi:poly-gamma-glutamate biosynthesis protein PgsC/CapC, partial [Staphylococcus epidermidis]|uniref:poly-gamma-glutamate biosynthesis protein PgsC/CapC n=1 Tax=Staphylococcus epidermidis TaxID=1282 RepID=UPI0037D9F4CE
MISSLTYFILTNRITNSLILYPTTKFPPIILTPILIKFIFHLLYPFTPFQMVQLSPIPLLIPPIIPNTIQKQALLITLSTTILLTSIT